MKMNAPFFQGRLVTGAWRTGERVRQVAENGAPAGRFTSDDLVKINVVGKFLQRGARRRRGRNLERGTQVDFADLDAVLDQAGQCDLGLLKLDGKMARVVVHAQVFVEARVARMLGAELIKETDGFRAGFEEAHRFWFQTEMQVAASLAADMRDVFDAAPDVMADGLERFAGQMKSFE